MSTHYGRMVVLDDRVAAVRQPRGRRRVHRLRPQARRSRRRTPCTRRTARSTSSSTATCTSGTRAPTNWVKGARGVRQGLDRVLPRLPGPRPAGDALDARALPEVLGRGLREGRVRGRLRRQGGLPVDVPEGLVHERLQRHRAERRAAGPLPGQADRQRPLGPARRRGRPASSSRPTTRKYGSRASSSTPPSGQGGSRGWKLTDPEAVPFLEKCDELGIKNIHVHKGPTIWPLDKDAFDVADIDHVATDFPELNFIVEHVGPAADRGLLLHGDAGAQRLRRPAVVVGGLIHARPRFFAKVMGELLFWVGEDKMLFGSDYAIWEPKWQVEGFVDWEIPEDDEFSDYPRLDDGRQEEDPRPQRRQAVRRRGAAGAAAARRGRHPAARDDAAAASRAPREPDGAQVLDGARHGLRPGARRADHRARLRRLLRRVGDGDVDVRLRLPTPQCAPNFAYLMAADARAAVRRLPGVARGERSCSRTTTRATRSTPRSARGGGVRRRVPRRDRGRAGRAARAVPAQGAARAPGAGVPGAARRRRDARGGRRAARRRPAGRRRTRERCARAARRARPAARTDDAPAFVAGDGAPLTRPRPADWLRRARLVQPEPRDQRRHLPRPAARPLRLSRPRGGGGMKAARLHAYHEPLKLDEVDEPKVTGPLDVDRADRRGRAVPHRPAHPGGPVGREVRGRAALHARPRERRLGRTRSAPASRTSRSATR